jgi:hypothetical protein
MGLLKGIARVNGKRVIDGTMTVILGSNQPSTGSESRDGEDS